MLKEILILVTLLGANDHTTREKAQYNLEHHDICFECLVEHYPKNIKDPEIRIRLKNVLWVKYIAEYSDDYLEDVYIYDQWGSSTEKVQKVNFTHMWNAFEYDLKQKIKEMK